MLFADTTAAWNSLRVQAERAAPPQGQQEGALEGHGRALRRKISNQEQDEGGKCSPGALKRSQPCRRVEQQFHGGVWDTLWGIHTRGAAELRLSPSSHLPHSSIIPVPMAAVGSLLLSPGWARPEMPEVLSDINDHPSHNEPFQATPGWALQNPNYFPFSICCLCHRGVNLWSKPPLSGVPKAPE